jgi:5-methylcytosine-specific restriction protein B
MGPVLDAVRALGGTATPKMVQQQIQQSLKLPEELLADKNKSGQTKFYNELHWARQYLVWEGLLDSQERGQWKLTAAGKQTFLDEAASQQLAEKWAEVHKQKSGEESDDDAKFQNELPPDDLFALKENSSDFVLDPRIQQALRASYESLLKRGEFLTKEKLAECYALFRERFGPERLQSLDGEVLLNTMHAHGNQDSLVYWLEFKSSPEFPTRQFGSISGGSALKFGLYKNTDSGEWMNGHPTNQNTLSTDDAIAIARKHREQLIAAVGVIKDLPVGASDEQYLDLQNKLDKIAPDVSRLAWGHKYLSLLFPDKLDDFHAEFIQKHTLVKLLQVPPTQPGLYVAAGRFVRLAMQMNWPMNHLTGALNERNGPAIKYWRIGTKLGEGVDAQNIWPDMKAGGYAAVGWAELGDLSSVLASADVKENLAAMLVKEYQNEPNVASRKAGEIRNFAKDMKENDVILAADGDRILGIGIVKGPYRFETTPPDDAPHRRQVDWHITPEWKLPVSEGLRTTVWKLRKDDRNLVAIETKLLDPALPVVSQPLAPAQPSDKTTRKVVRLEGKIPGQLQAILERKGQAILYGPPGTGKTHWGKKTALDLAAVGAFGCLYENLTPEQRTIVDGDDSNSGLLRSCTFHPAFGYEDFIEGYRPRQGTGGQLVFEKRDGIFKKLCSDASKSDKKFVLLIDEINRGDIPRIFGELLTLLEKNKRGQKVILPMSGDTFSVPPNVLVIGTMNTADRSIALLDTALRRRFGFVELMPDYSILAGASAGEAIPVGKWLEALNNRVRQHVGKDARNLQIGHAYLLDDNGKPVTDFAMFARIIAEDIIPLLEEYCYENYDALSEILGEAMIDRERQRVRDELFSPARHPDLIQALMAPSPDVSTSLEAVTQVQAPPVQEPEEEPEEPAK